MLNYNLVNLYEEIAKHQKSIIEQLKNADKDETKKLDKELDAITLFTNALIKFRRSIQ